VASELDARGLAVCREGVLLLTFSIELRPFVLHQKVNISPVLRNLAQLLFFI
jgi:hypothetical protein